MRQRLKKIITDLKNSKGKDVHGIDTNFVKSHSAALVQPITFMINLSTNQKVVPSAWKVATVSPIFKTTSKTKADSA